MRLVCSMCSAAYEAPDSLFGPQPREVRCHRCGHQWTVTVPAVASETPPAPAPLPAPIPEPAPQSTATVPLPSDAAHLADALPPQAPASQAPASLSTPAAEAEMTTSTRALLADIAPEPHDLDRPDAEERRLSHELSFGETEYRSKQTRPRRRRAVWLIGLIVIVLIIAAILFEPQLIHAFPVLDGLYATVGL